VPTHPVTSDRLFIVGIGGTTRKDSASERSLRLALAAAERLGASTRLFDGASLPIEPFDPGREGRSAQAAALVAALRRADGVIVATPSYHGSLSGLVKNALDYSEDLRDDPRPYLDGRAVGCIVVAEGAQAMGSTLIAVRSIVHALRGWPTPYAAAIDAKARPFGADGETPAANVAVAIDTVVRQVVEFARMRRLLHAPVATTP
jgi:FMN reductase